MRHFYSLIFFLLLPLVLLRLAWRGLRAPDYWKRWSERFGFVPFRNKQPALWLHAVSVGEVQAAAPLIRKLLEDQPGKQLLVTTTTPTGSRHLRKLFPDQVQHCYLPWDIPFMMQYFLDRTRPCIAVMMETEIWPNLYHQCGQRGIPLIVANARLSEKSLRGYQRVASLIRNTLGCIDHIAARGQQDADRFIQLGANPEQVQITGSIKFDMDVPPSVQEQADVMRRDWGQSRPVWIAASTHEGEDEQVLAAHKQILDAFPECLLVIVPRHPERFDRVAELVQKVGFKLQRRSQQRACDAHTQVFLGDSMGEMLVYLGACDIAFVGGSLVPTGGHNLLEPAALGKPVLTGPHTFNFTETADLFLDQQAALRVTDSAELATVLKNLLADPARRSELGEKGQKTVEANRGALESLRALINSTQQC